jgi:hypothetical protein
MSGNGDTMPPSDMERVKKRYAQICTARAPSNELEGHVTWRIATHWILHENCEQRLALVYTEESHRACWDWEEMQRAAAQELVVLLTRDPVRAAAQLLQSPAGCAALIDQWDGLDGCLEKNGSWTEAQHARALDLMGIDPLVRDSGRTPFDPRPGDHTTFPNRARKVIAEHIAWLQQRAAAPPMQRTDERRREAVIKKQKVLDSREARLAERYRGEQARRMEWWWRVLNKLQGKEGQVQARESEAHAEHLKRQRQNERHEETVRLLRQAGVLQEGETAPQWAEATTQDLAAAVQRLAQFQAACAEAQIAAAEAAAEAAEAQPAPKIQPEVAEVLDQGPVIPVAAAPSPTPAPVPPEPSSSQKKGKKADKPLSRRERRKQELNQRQEERRQKAAIASGYNDSPPRTSATPMPPPAA